MLSQMPRFSELVRHLVQAHDMEIMEATQVLTMKLKMLEEELQRHGVWTETSGGVWDSDVSAKVGGHRRSSRHKDNMDNSQEVGGHRRSSRHKDNMDNSQEASSHRRSSRHKDNLDYSSEVSSHTRSSRHKVNMEHSQAAKSEDEAPHSNEAEKPKHAKRRRSSAASKLSGQEASSKSLATSSWTTDARKVRSPVENEHSADEARSSPPLISPGCDCQFRETSLERTERGNRGSTHKNKRKRASKAAQAEEVAQQSVAPSSNQSSDGESGIDPPESSGEKGEQVCPPSGLPTGLAIDDSNQSSQLPGEVMDEEEQDKLESLTASVAECLSSGSRGSEPPAIVKTSSNESPAASAVPTGSERVNGGCSDITAEVEHGNSPAMPPTIAPSAADVARRHSLHESLHPDLQRIHSGASVGNAKPHQSFSMPVSPVLGMKPEELMECPDFSTMKLQGNGLAGVNVVAISNSGNAADRRVTWCMAPMAGGLGLSQAVPVGQIAEKRDSGASCHEDEEPLELWPVWNKVARRSINLAPGTSSAALLRRTAHSTTRQLTEDELNLEDRSCFDKAAEPLIARPGSRNRLVWDVFGMVFIGYDLVAIPLQVFDPPSNIFTTFMSWLTIIFWTLDIPCSFLVGFHSEGLVEMRLEKIARRYAQTWLTFDLVVITMDWLISVAGAISASLASNSVSYVRVGRALRFMRLLRLLRIMKVHGLLNDILELVQSEFLLIILGIAKLLGFIIVINHLVACFWFGVGSLDFSSGDNNWVKYNELKERAIAYQYATSLHWSLTQFTPASMEVTPKNTAERFFTISVIIFAMVTFSSFISSVTNATTRLRNLNSENVQAQAALRQYLAENKVPTTLMGRIWGSLNQLMNKSKRRLHEKDVSILQMLPWSLKAELRDAVYTPILVIHPFFAHYYSLDHRSCRKIYQACLSEVSLGIGQEQFTNGQTASTMLFVLHGILSYSKADKPEGLPPGMLSSGAWVSEPVMWIKWKHNGQLVATTHCELLSMNVSKAHEVMEHKENAARYAKRFLRFFKENREALSDIWADTDIISDMVTKAFLGEEDDQQKALDAVRDAEGRSRFNNFANFMPGNNGSRRPSILGLGGTAPPGGAGAGGRRPSLWGAGSLFGGFANSILPPNKGADIENSSSSSDSDSSSSSQSSNEDEERQDKISEGSEGSHAGSHSGISLPQAVISPSRLHADEDGRTSLLGSKQGTPTAPRSRAESLAQGESLATDGIITGIPGLLHADNRGRETLLGSKKGTPTAPRSRAESMATGDIQEGTVKEGKEFIHDAFQSEASATNSNSSDSKKQVETPVVVVQNPARNSWSVSEL